MTEAVGGAAVDTDVVTKPSAGASADGVDEQLVDELVAQARLSGLQLTGVEGLLAQLTKRLLESDLEGEISDHLGYDRRDPAGNNGGNSRNGIRSKTVWTEVGPVDIAVPARTSIRINSRSRRLERHSVPISRLPGPQMVPCYECCRPDLARIDDAKNGR